MILRQLVVRLQGYKYSAANTTEIDWTFLDMTFSEKVIHSFQ